jgi:DNA anti-recombination protein RmuC
MKKIFPIVALALFCPSIAMASGFAEILRDPLTLFFMIAILGSTIYLLVFRYDRFAAIHGPEILTTMGIFGCFFGIALALLNFDPKDVTHSVPELLNGVKTAFWASVCGVAGALAIKVRQRFGAEPVQSKDEPRNASLDDVVSSIGLLRKSIAGENDSSLISQIKLMRQEQNDNANNLRKSLDEFADKVSELGSKALIEALESVIRDFNTQLNEQFGENFKQLNLAVEKLVIWQQQYKEELDKLQVIQRDGAISLKTSADSFSSVVEKASSYTESANRLEELLIVFKSQYALMAESQESLAKVLTDMKSVEPSFSAKLEDLTQTFKSSTVTLADETKKQIQIFGEMLNKTVPEIQNKVNEQIASTNDQLKKSFDTLDKNLEAELEKALVGLGQQLASLSEKFVQDYTPLTERLKEVVNMSKGV